MDGWGLRSKQTSAFRRHAVWSLLQSSLFRSWPPDRGTRHIEDRINTSDLSSVSKRLTWHTKLTTIKSPSCTSPSSHHFQYTQKLITQEINRKQQWRTTISPHMICGTRSTAKMNPIPTFNHAVIPTLLKFLLCQKLIGICGCVNQIFHRNKVLET